MKIVGLTGGIGSGKTTVAKAFHAYGIPLYISDVEAKKLMVESQEIKNLLTQLFGPDTYLNGELNRPFIADKIFNDDTLLHQMNAIIHPRVAQHFKDWVNRQDDPYVIKESAILFESKANIGCDIIITVTLDKATRIKRLLKRDKTTVEKIEAIMKKQWPDVKRIALSDYVIVNDTLEHMKLQVAEIHKTILNKIG